MSDIKNDGNISKRKHVIAGFGFNLKICLHFPEHKLRIVVDEKGHEDRRNIDYKKNKKKSNRKRTWL